MLLLSAPINSGRAPLTVSTWGGSLQGKERSQNQDVWGLDHEQGIYVLSDGMGGHLEGARAARQVVSAMLAPLGPARGGDEFPLAWLKQKALQAHGGLLRLAGELGHQNDMGATLAGLLIKQGNYYLVWVGDSRIYRWREGELSQLSQDHNLAAEQLAQGLVSPHEAARHPLRNVLTQAMGMKSIEPGLAQGAVMAGDRFLLTSDGLHNAAGQADMSRITQQAPTCREAGKALLDLVDQRRGGDDATVVVIECGRRR